MVWQFARKALWWLLDGFEYNYIYSMYKYGQIHPIYMRLHCNFLHKTRAEHIMCGAKPLWQYIYFRVYQRIQINSAKPPQTLSGTNLVRHVCVVYVEDVLAGRI